MKEGKHALPTIPNGTPFVALLEGDWEFYVVSPQRAAKKVADAQSYMWDQLIEYQCSFIRAGTAISLPELTATASHHERIIRALADESRLSRRQLAAHFRYALFQSEPDKKFARVVISHDRPNRAYVFLTIPKSKGTEYEEYREIRIAILLTYCYGVKLKFKDDVEVIGVASEPLTEEMSSQDFMYVGNEPLDNEEIARWSAATAELDVLQSPTTKANGKEHEFPIAFNFSKGTEFHSTENKIPMNRAARRSVARQTRKKF